MNSSTQQRDLAASIAAVKPDQALEIARRIQDPWYRCQALSHAALHLGAVVTQKRVIDEAFASANELNEPNRVVTVSSWAVKALVLIGNVNRATSEVDRLLTVIGAEGSPVRRADALRTLLGAIITTKAAIAVRVAQAFASACLQPLSSGKRNKKGEYLLEESIPAIARLNRTLASELAKGLPPSRSERALQSIERAKNVPVEELMPWPHIR